MRLQIAIVTVILILGFPRSARVDSRTGSNVVTACADFGPDGSSVTAEVYGTDSKVEITSLDGKVSGMSLARRYPVAKPVPEDDRLIGRRSGCAVYFSDDSEYVALGISSSDSQLKVTHLQIAVANLKTAKWVSDWGLDRSPSLFSPSLTGFLEHTTSLVVVARAESDGTIAIQSFSPFGQQLSSNLVHRDRSQTTDAFRFYADALHNRLWAFSCSSTRVKPYHVPLCPVTVTNLLGEHNEASQLAFSDYKEKRDDLWQWPVTFVAADANTLMIAETVNGKDTVWRVKTSPQNVEHFVLPHHHFLKYNGLVYSAMSPDAEIYAVLLEQHEIAFPYIVDNYVFRGTDVVVMRTHPLRLLGTIPHQDASFTGALAVDHRDAKARVLVYRRGQWERHEFADAKPAT